MHQTWDMLPDVTGYEESGLDLVQWCIVSNSIHKDDSNAVWTIYMEGNNVYITPLKEDAKAQCKEIQESVQGFTFKAVSLPTAMYLLAAQPDLAEWAARNPRWNIDDLLDELVLPELYMTRVKVTTSKGYFERLQRMAVIY